MLRRRLLGVLSLLSLILCVATVVLWVRSYWVAYDFKSSTARTTSKKDGYRASGWGVSIGKGGIAFVVESDGFRPPSDPTTESHTDRELSTAAPYWPGTHSPPSIWRRIGFCSERTVWTNSMGYLDSRYVTIPLWLISILAALPPTLLLVSRSRHPNAPGLCPACGYDLRATPERCPECNWRRDKVKAG